MLAGMTGIGQHDHESDNGVAAREAPTVDLLQALQNVRQEEEHRELLRHGLVDELRRRHVPWSLIEETTGVSERTLRRKYGRPFVGTDYLRRDLEL